MSQFSKTSQNRHSHLKSVDVFNLVKRITQLEKRITQLKKQLASQQQINRRLLNDVEIVDIKLSTFKNQVMAPESTGLRGWLQRFWAWLAK